MAKASFKRSPNYPSINLDRAIARARQIYDENHDNWASSTAVAGTFGLSPTSSSLKTLVGTLIQFGLMEEMGGGDSRQFRLTPVALALLVRHPSTSEYRQALKTAALKPKLHKELWDKYEGRLPPGNHALRSYLLSERKPTFHSQMVDGFIQEFRQTLALAGLDGADTIPEHAESEENEEVDDGAPAPVVGDFVQWTSQGVDRFQEPKKINGFSDDGDFAFIEGVKPGIPTSQLTVVERTNMVANTKVAPTNPHYREEEGRQENAETSRLKLKLQEGPVVLEWPATMSEDSVAELEDWLGVLIRGFRRRHKLPRKSDES